MRDMYEIEIKAWLSDTQAAEKKVAQFAQYAGSAEKSDRYWIQPESDGIPDAADCPRCGCRVRIRESVTSAPDGTEEHATTVTYKRKELRVDTEINEEHEFTVSDAGAFEIFIRAAGFVPSAEKHKSAEIWKCGNALIEIVHVAQLGDFIEIEILTENAGEKTAEQCRRELLQILEAAGVPETDIETRYYTEMLAEKQRTGQAE